MARQVAEGDHGSPKLAGALGTLRFHSEIFNDAVLETKRAFFAPAINVFRRAPHEGALVVRPPAVGAGLRVPARRLERDRHPPRGPATACGRASPSSRRRLAALEARGEAGARDGRAPCA